MNKPLRLGVAGLGNAGKQVTEFTPKVPDFILAAVDDRTGMTPTLGVTSLPLLGKDMAEVLHSDP